MNEAEELVTCPYNKAHSILKGRMQFHLARCKSQNNLPELLSCPYNSTHVVPKLELEFHQQICRSRIVLDSFVYQMGNTDCPAKDTVPINKLELPPCEENWDDDGIEHSVLDVVKEKAKDKGVLLNLIGAPKAQRKAHRYEERQRFQRVTEGQSPHSRQEESTRKRPGHDALPSKDQVMNDIKDVRFPRGRGSLLQERLIEPRFANGLNRPVGKKPKGKVEVKNEPDDTEYVNDNMAQNLKDLKISKSYGNVNQKPSPTLPQAQTIKREPKFDEEPISITKQNGNILKETSASVWAPKTSRLVNGNSMLQNNTPFTKAAASKPLLMTPASFAAAAAKNNNSMKDTADLGSNERNYSNTALGWGFISKNGTNIPSSSDFPSLPISGRGRGRGRLGN